MDKRILILDGDAAARLRIGALLTGYGLETIGAGSAREMEQVLRETQVSLVMLDLLLPDASGLAVCARLLALPSPPAIMVVSDAGDECDVVVALEVGADDYVVKPFRPRELLARVKAVLRRSDNARPGKPAATASPAYRFEGWRLNAATQELFDPLGGTVALSTAEFLVLWALVARPNEVLTRDQLRQGPPDAHFRSAPRQVNVAISRLRGKLDRAGGGGGGQMIRTIRHVGYIFAARVDRVHAD